MVCKGPTASLNVSVGLFQKNLVVMVQTSIQAGSTVCLLISLELKGSPPQGGHFLSKPNQFEHVCFCLFLLLVAEHLIAQHSAIKMLHSRVKIILEYVKAVEAGETCHFRGTKAKECENKSAKQLSLNQMFHLLSFYTLRHTFIITNSCLIVP